MYHKLQILISFFSIFVTEIPSAVRPLFWSIELSDIQLKPKEMINLSTCLSQNETLRELKLVQLGLEDDDMINLGGALNVKESLEVLDLARNFIGSSGIQSLLRITKSEEESDLNVESLNGMLQLQYLFCSRWCIT